MNDASGARAAALRAKAFFENMTPGDLARLGSVYADGASFRDPFNDVTGVEAIARVYARMYEQIDDPRFTIVETIADADGAMLVWDLRYRAKGGRSTVLQRIHGASHLKFADDGRIAYHRDYWDAAGELYERLPVVGALMRWLKRRIA
jgi:ketosteroid isomerase-like protein